MKKGIIGLLVVIILAGGAYAVFHKSTPAAKTSNSAPKEGQLVPRSAPPTPIEVIQNSDGSSYLADSNNIALYTYGNDTSGVSNCTGSCLAMWPAYTTTNVPSYMPDGLGVFKRPDTSATQFTYKGMPLYYYKGDGKAGVTSGDGVDNFSLAKP